ncbi:SPOR domain-containing protein [Devosia sp. SL43]|uniref:SPOR domain-containing protein n=1 Tax=Devosia sp. SL43 TaxID=2806348 RepID=UPI001F373EAE|nr:SPOR domain-containing protein [Devosia sp. SL43]UJW85961.1 SPOR domain-containing protein [Devosia sp. SL43]
MAGQSDAADDLIAELAKLMAQDAQGGGNAAATPAAPPLYPVRIPGGDAPQPAPQAKADLDFVRSFNAEPAERPAPAPATAPVEAQRAPAAQVDEPEPFKFDFDFGAKHAPSEPVVLPVAAKPQATPAPAPASVIAAPAGPASAPVTQDIDHDSIADLIAADLAADTQPAPSPAPTRSEATPAAAPVVVAAEPAPMPVAESRQPNPGPGWTPTTVAANLGGQQRPARPALRAVNLQPVARPEQDRFKVPPVFGLATTPAKSTETIVPTETSVPAAEPVVAAPAPVQLAPVETQPIPRPAAPTPVAPLRPADQSDLGLDPIDEIESLIGRAMRVEFDQVADADEPVVAPPPVESRPAPSPALRSLATPTMAPAPAPSALSAADEAVLAAAAATGAQVGWVEAPEVSDTDDEPRQRTERSRGPFALGMTRAVAGPLVAVTLLLAAGFGLYWVLGLGGRDTGGVAPLLTADATPIKQVAPAATTDTAATQQSVVFNEIDGVVPGAEEQLVSRDQADVNEVTQVASAVPADVSEEGLANRKVRTVTVRPDGTIVSGDDSIAGSAILPVDRPNVPAVPGAETASPELLAAADPVTPAAAAPAAPVTPAVTPVEPGATVPAFDLTGNPIAGKTTVVPLVRPANLASIAPTAASPVTAVVDPINAVIDAAAAPVAAEPVAAPVAAAPVEQPVAVPGATEVAALGNDAPAYVQLASQRSEAEARQTAQAMVTRFGPLFGGANMEVQRVDLGAKGIYYRVRVPANSLEQANNICTNVKAAGGDCFTM